MEKAELITRANVVIFSRGDERTLLKTGCIHSNRLGFAVMAAYNSRTIPFMLYSVEINNIGLLMYRTHHTDVL